VFYQFPIIKVLDDVIPAIKDSKEFITVEKDGYTVIDYVLSSNETFPPVTSREAAIRRECRGLLFDKRGKLIRRAYHKFFNLGEREENLNPDFSQPHSILEKLDGSMVTPFYVNGGIRWATRMGITDTSMQAEVFIAHNPKYVDIAKRLLDLDFTPIFEWCSRQNRIVIDHPEDKLILTAVRNMTTGEYMRLDHWIDLPKVQSFFCDLATVGNLTDTEGVVVRFDNGHMVKLKTEWYVRIHKNKELVQNERRLVDVFMANQVDDVKAFLPEQDQQKIDAYTTKLILTLAEYTVHVLDIWKRRGKDRKEFALMIAPRIPRQARNIVFKLFDRPDLTVDELFDIIRDVIRKHLGSEARFRDLKQEMFNDLVY
jgi:T4 RnlA family RNA ligase